MTSKQRVRALLSGEKLLLSHFWGEDSTVEHLLRYYGGKGEADIALQLKSDLVNVAAVTPEPVFSGGFYENYWGERYVMQDTGFGLMREDLPGALSEAETLEDIEAFAWPQNDIFDYSKLYEACLCQQEYGLMYGNADIWQRQALVRGFENGLLDLALNPEWVHFMARKYVDFYKEDYSRAYKASRGLIDIFVIFSDVGSQKAPLMSAEMFESFVLPYLRELVQHIHGLGAKVMYHSCGMIAPFIGRLIAAGVDIIDPIQPVTEEMQPEALAESYGGQVIFHGGISVQDVLKTGTEAQIRACIQRYTAVFQGRCGYICCSTHFMQPDIPIENIRTMYDEIEKLKNKMEGGA